MIVRLILILCLTANAVMALAQDTIDKTLIVGSEEDLPPFAIGKTDETASGFTVDLWKEVAKEAGLKYSIRVRPWGQILQEFKEGKIDVLINVAQSEERHKYTDFSVPHVTVNGAIFVRKGESRIRSEADLAGKSIIVFKSDLAHEYAISKGWGKQLVIVSNAQEGLKLLASGQHDAMLLSKLTGKQILSDLNIENIKALDVKAGYAQKFSFGVHKGNSELLAKLNEGLAITMADSDYKDIYHKWFGLYEERKPSYKDVLPYILPVLAISLIIGGYNYRKRQIERKQAEIDLSQQKALFEAIFRCIPDAIVYANADREVIEINSAFSSIFGFTIDDLAGKKTSFFYESLEEYERQGRIRFNLTAAEHSLPYEVRYRKKDGSIFPGESLGTAIKNASGTQMGYIGVIRDITGRKQAEEERQEFELQLQHSQKLESLGVLSGGIAHDFNNILAIIIGYCGLIKMDCETAEKNILEIEKAAERAAGLCRQMLAYAGKAQLTKTQVNMWMLVNEMITMLKSTLPPNTVIKSDLAKNIPIIDGDESQIRQIVMNLIINASEAIGTEQGEIQVSLVKKTISDGQQVRDYQGKTIPPGGYVYLEVTDTGCGMDEEAKWRIFEPFFTTKFTGRGLGMSSVLGIINSHGGMLQLFSQLDQGTTFKIYLPVQKTDSVGDEIQIRAVSPVPWQGSGTILLVEDEDQVRLVAKTLLGKFGFTVLEAVNGKEALELYRKNSADIILVVTDMGMPVMDGYELFQELKNLDSKLPIIISSGFGDSEISSRIGSDHISGIISKPYNSDQLREVLKCIVENAPS